MGARLYHLARGEDYRRVSPHEPMKSISAETTFNEDTSDRDLLDGHIWRLSEKVSDRAKAKDLAGTTVTLKLRRADFSRCRGESAAPASLHFTIGAGGEVRSAEARGVDGQISAEPAHVCLVEVLRGLKFPTDMAGLIVSYPLR